MNKNYYQIFGLPSNATDEEIKKEYRKLAKKFHPDKNSNDKYFEERFKELQEAYDVLSDPGTRKRYDLSNSKPTPKQQTSSEGIKSEQPKKEGMTPESIAVDVETAYRKIKWSEISDINHGHLIKYIDSLLNDHIVSQLLRIGHTDSNERIVACFARMLKFLSEVEIPKYAILLIRLAGTNNELILEIHKIEKEQIKEKNRASSFLALKWTAAIAFAIGIIYSINSEDKSATPSYMQSNTVVNRAPELEELPSKFKGNMLKTGDSPYNNYFGKGVYDKNFQNRLEVKNGQQLDVIVCLTEFYDPKKTIRNEYIRAGDTFIMTNVPNGTYLLKSFYGEDWNPTITVNGGALKGYFETKTGFSISDRLDDLIKMQQTEESYSIYSVTLYPVVGGNMESRSISADDFF